MILGDLPHEHPLRNMPLADIKAQYQITTKGQMWHEVKPAFGIARMTYNQLGAVWVHNHVWKAEEPEPICRKCGGVMVPGLAIEQTWTGIPDFIGGAVMTVSPGGPGKLSECLKCSVCGWSVTK